MLFSCKLLVLAASLLASNPVVSVLGRRFVIRNDCPLPINYYINGESQGPLWANGGQVDRQLIDNFSGFIYTDANGGNQNGVGTTRAGFFLERGYYYIVIDPDYLNTGVSITTNSGVRPGFCVAASCVSNDFCPDVFTSPPTRFPEPGPLPPQRPLYGCNNATAEYYVTFCPNRNFPTTRAVTLHPNGNKDKCLDVRGAQYANGTPVQIYDCNGTGAQRWRVRNGRTQVVLDGTNFCLDAGSSPGNGVGMKIWQCYDNLPAQDWYYTDDARIALTGRASC
ncbi:hypothetical protein AX16_009403 [Volvariella volvacea WC 439]|nr:hypothetical protein AX16_009403 [Volvariella volvacea WC 439]